MDQNGASRLFVGEVHWWTTDAEVESVLSKYGRVKEFKFFDGKRSARQMADSYLNTSQFRPQSQSQP